MTPLTQLVLTAAGCFLIIFAVVKIAPIYDKMLDDYIKFHFLAHEINRRRGLIN